MELISENIEREKISTNRYKAVVHSAPIAYEPLDKPGTWNRITNQAENNEIDEFSALKIKDKIAGVSPLIDFRRGQGKEKSFVKISVVGGNNVLADYQYYDDLGYCEWTYLNAFDDIDLRIALSGHVLQIELDFHGWSPGEFRLKFNEHGLFDLNTLRGEDMVISHPILISAVGERTQLYWERDDDEIFVTLPDIDLTGYVLDPSISIQPATDDTYIDSANPAVNYGANVALTTNSSGLYALLRFDCSALLVTDICSLAMVRLASAGSSIKCDYSVRHVTDANGDWTELGATWNTKDGANPWAGAAGCSTAGTDYLQTSLSYIAFPHNSIDTFSQYVTLSADEVQRWFGVATNNGIIIGHTSLLAAVGRNWHSSDSLSVALRPELVIFYDTTNAIGIIPKHWESFSGGAASYTTANIYPTADRLLLVSVWATDDDAVLTVPTLSGMGVASWDLILSQRCDGAGFEYVHVFRSRDAGAVTGTITANFAGDTIDYCVIAVHEYSNTIDGANGANAIIQTDGNEQLAAMTVAASLAAFADPVNICFVTGGCDVNQNNMFTYNSDYGQIGWAGTATGRDYGTGTVNHFGEDLAPTINWSNANADGGIIAIEIGVAPYVPPPPGWEAPAILISGESHEQSRKLTIQVSSPIWSIKSSLGFNIENYDSYNHNLLADGGYGSATIKFSATISDIEIWFADRLGFDIKVFSPDSMTEIFNGFIDKITVNLGGLASVRGPLSGISNRVNLIYSSVDTTTIPPIVGNRTVVGWEDNQDSQDKFGIMERVLSAGGIPDAIASQVRDTYLDENNLPVVSQSLTLGTGSDVTITLTVQGYKKLFENYTYTDTTSGTRTITQRLQDVIGADPSARFSADYAFIETNTTTVLRYENDLRTAIQIIKGDVSKGDSSFNRYIWGVYSRRRFHYEQIPSEIEYYYNLRDPGGFVRNQAYNVVEPWLVLPGKWLLISDWLVGKVAQGSELKNDPRALFIENVSYTAPYGLSINGSKVRNLPQMLGQLGLSGVGG